MDSVIKKAVEMKICSDGKQRFKVLLEEGLKSISLTAEEWVEAVKESGLERASWSR